MIVAIDGPAASGKSTVAKMLATAIGAHYLDTGAMYRAVALAALQSGISLDDTEALTRLSAALTITFEHTGGSPLPTAVLLDGVDVTSAIRTPEVDAAVSAVAKTPGVRAILVSRQRQIASAEPVLVAEGRDVGTVVFPHAAVKVFLTASPQERARRRHAEMTGRGHAVENADVLAGIANRDEADSTRDASPLLIAADAVELDTTGLSVAQVVAKIASLVEERHR
ncbi:MAG: (d)CMP kinase [Clostridiales bacterium]|nr:(d)CMP kinase [Clostridiales bacterium]